MSVFMKRISSAAALGVAMLIGSSLPASAGYVVTLEEAPDNAVPLGSDIVATGSGPIDLTDLTLVDRGFARAFVVPASGVAITGPFVAQDEIGNFYDGYTGYTGPANFGGPGQAGPVCPFGPPPEVCPGSGDIVGIFVPFPLNPVLPVLFVPRGYASDSPLSSSTTFPNATFASMGGIPGTYEWTWGTGPNQNFTLEIGPAAAVPEPASVLLLAGALVGLVTLLGVGSRSAAGVSQE